jgi:hypothetical protein
MVETNKKGSSDETVKLPGNHMGYHPATIALGEDLQRLTKPRRK